MTFVAPNDVAYCESGENYTRFFLTEGPLCLGTKPMRDRQDLLEERDFLRVHRQYLINLNHIEKFVRGKGNYLIPEVHSGI